MKISQASWFIVALLLALPARAEDKSTVLAHRQAMLQTLGRGAEIISRNEQYQIISGARATQIAPREKPQQTLTRIGGNSLIETKGSFIVFTAPERIATSVVPIDASPTYPVAFNARTGGIGILPGTLSVKLANNANADAIASDHGLELVRQFPHLQLAFYKVRNSQNLVAESASLAADARVAKVEIEVIENIKVAH